MLFQCVTSELTFRNRPTVFAAKGDPFNFLIISLPIASRFGFLEWSPLEFEPLNAIFSNKVHKSSLVIWKITLSPLPWPNYVVTPPPFSTVAGVDNRPLLETPIKYMTHMPSNCLLNHQTHYSYYTTGYLEYTTRNLRYSAGFSDGF